MNRFLLIASILAFLGNFGNCAPPVMPTKISGIFHLDYDNFKENVAEKTALYKPGTTEDLFLDALSRIIQSTYLATDEIICYVNILNDIELTQFKHFSNDKNFAELTFHKNTLTEKLTNLMNKLTPVNEINKQLWTMMDLKMNANTKIGKEVFEQLKEAALKITSYTNIFEKMFKDFPMLALMEHLYAVTKVTEDFKNGNILRTAAVEKLNESATALNSIVPAMTKTVNFVIKMDNNALYEAQQNFRNIVMKALNVKIFFGDFCV